MKLKKILFSDNTLWGLLNFRRGVIEYMIRSGFEVVLVAPTDPMCDLEELPGGAKYIPVELSRTGTNVFADLAYYKALKRIYRAERPDYIFHYTIKPNIYGTLAARSLGIRSSAMIAGLGHVYSENGIGAGVARAMYKYAMRYPQKVMVLNRANRDTLLERKVVAPDKLVWLEGGEGVDLSKFAPQPMPSNERPVFLMICRLLYEKGYAEYVAAAEALRGRAEFRIMGPIDSHPAAVPRSVVEADAARGVIRYIEFSPDVLSQAAQADCIVLPSYYHEGLSRVLMEALAFGRPIVASDIAGCRETVRDGANGFLCAPKDAASLTEACRRFLALSPGQRAKMARQSRLLAEQVFDERSVIRTYSELAASV
ncbi:MAG: glycosyltransferase family 4 protein [Rikenellaceae bacterium]|nr:glycosyltransferase family 4 protein [Rikenellaceae bacterium]